jgi:tetratricopeptide (TPR) repeat protein
MATPLESAIVRIRSVDGAVVGAGFLVTDRHILTCAHVVADALDLPPESPDPPQADVNLDFPLLAAGQILTARVAHWQPRADVTALKLPGDPPAGATPLRPITARDLWGHSFRAYGFPTGYDQGVWASGVSRGRQADGWVQIEDEKETGYFVAPGFSGTPVWDEQLNGVVGIAVAADVQTGIRAAFMIPAHSLIEAWSDLRPHSLKANSLEYLQEQLTALEAAQQTASDPRRFQHRIDELRAAIDNWDGRVEKQRRRIADGLEEQRQQLAEKSTRRDDRERLRVVGRRPQDVVDHFKNRAREQVTIGQLLAEPATRLVSVIGHGGMGKTALACKVLRDMERHRWPHTEEQVPLDGIIYLSTRTAGISLERLFLDCAKLLGGEQEKRLNTIWTNPQVGTEDKILRLLEALKDGRYVILLDNIEDLLDDQGRLMDEDLRLFFEHGLATSHGARLLVTSRVALAFRREVMRFDRQVKLLEGLPIPDGVALLRELDPNGDYGLRDAPEEGLAQAVSLVHGVPRALEVMAGILANDPFASLTDVLYQFYEQEDVVQMLIEENYKRMDDNARRVIEALAVFRRPVPPLAVDYLLEPFAPGLDVPGIIRRLTRANIVSVDRATKTATLHPIDQDYVYRQLPEESETEANYTRQALERRAAGYYVQLRTPPETWKRIDDLEPQLAEFEHRVRAGDFDDACRVLEPIDYDYLYLWGHYARLVEMRERLLERLTDPRLRAANLEGLGRTCRPLGKLKRAISYYQKALDTVRDELGDRRAEGSILGNLGTVYRNLGQIKRACKLHEKALTIAREVGDRKVESQQLGRLGTAHSVLDEIEQAIKELEEALKIARKIGSRRYESFWLHRLGLAYHAQGDLVQAIDCLEEGRDIAREIGERRAEGYCLIGLAHALLTDKRFAEAGQCCDEADKLNVTEIRYEVALALGITLLRQHGPAARDTFADAAARCRAMLDKTTDFYEPRYTLSAALVGQAICDQCWSEESERTELLAPALAEYREALEICAAPGVVQDALRDLELIRAAGIEGLEPVFELLGGV